MTKRPDIQFIIPRWATRKGFPVGAGTLAAILQQEGFAVDVVDANAAPMSPAECVSRVLEKRPGLVCMTGLWVNLPYLREVSNLLRERSPSTKQVAGGWWAGPIPNLILDLTAVDHVVRGEADMVITDICQRLLDGTPIDRPGVYGRDNSDKFCDSDPYLQADDLSALPIPAYELFEIRRYFSPVSTNKVLKNAYLSRGDLRKTYGHTSNLTFGTIYSGRGCYGRCHFCSAAGQLRRNLAPESVVDHMAHLKERYGVNLFYFNESLTFSTKKWTQEFCRRLIDRNLMVLYRGQCRPDFNYDSETLSLMAQSGCYAITFGAESGDTDMLHSMGKGRNIDVEMGERLIHDFREHGIFVRGSFIVNMPGETLESLRNTIDFARRTRISASSGLAQPLPGTELYSFCVKNGIIKDERYQLLRNPSKGKGRDFDEYIRFFNYNNLSRTALLKAVNELRRTLYINRLFHRHTLLYRILSTVPMLVDVPRGATTAWKSVTAAARYGSTWLARSRRK